MERKLASVKASPEIVLASFPTPMLLGDGIATTNNGSMAILVTLFQHTTSV